MTSTSEMKLEVVLGFKTFNCEDKEQFVREYGCGKKGKHSHSGEVLTVGGAWGKIRGVFKEF